MTEPYARLYLTVVDDGKFEGIYDDDHHWATYTRLLMIAEGSWPASAHLPSTARRASIKALADRHIIDLQPGGRYRIHGLDPERARRSEHARTASKARWNAPSIPASNARASDVLMLDETRRDEHRRDEISPARAREGLPSITPEVAAAWETATGRSLLASGEFACRMVDDLCERQGAGDVLAAIPISRATFPKIPSPTQLAADIRNRLEPLRKGTPEEAPAFQPAPKRPAPPPVDAAERQRILRELSGKGEA